MERITSASNPVVKRLKALREAKAKYAERKAREAQGGRLVVAPRPA